MKFQQEYLSFDCAYKSLGVCHIILEFDIDALTEQINAIIDLTNLTSLTNQTINTLLSRVDTLRDMIVNILRVVDINTYDILPGNAKETDIETKTAALKQFLTRYHDISQDAIILIENQPMKIGGYGFIQKTNTESPIVAHQLCYHFSPRARMMAPTLKGKVSLGENMHLDYFMNQFAGKFKTKSEDKRKARKEHTKANLKWFLARFAPHIHLPESTADDAADAFMQFLAYLKI